MRAFGGEACYYYDRTYGLCGQWSNYEKWQYTDQNGVPHDIPTDPSWELHARSPDCDELCDLRRVREQ
jgi:hypothetical protein